MKNFSYRTLIVVLIFGLLSFNIPLTPAKASVDDGLVAHWELDEETGSELSDSANGNEGSTSGDVKHTLGKIGRALLFDESNQSANITSGSGELSAFSISFWLKTDDSSADAIISDNPLGFALVLCDSGKIGVKPLVNNEMILCGTKKVNDGEWHHVVITNGGLPDFFVDGVSAESGQWGWPPITLKKSTLGLNKTGTFIGYLDDVRIYDRALTTEGEADEVVALYALGSEENETEPYLEFTSQPEDTIDVNHAEYTFEAQYETELVCSLDDIELDDCVSPTNFTSLEAGDHTFKVTAFDELFNETTIDHTFNVDLGTPFVLATSTVFITTNVINNNGGTAQPSAFTITVTANNASNSSFAGSAIPVEVIFDGTGYSVSGSESSAYALSLSEECDGDLAVGLTASCTLTYDDILLIPSTDDGGSGGADENTNPGGFVPGTDGGDTGGADQNTNPGGFVPPTDDGGIGGADQNNNPGGFVPPTDDGGIGGADTDDDQPEPEQPAVAQTSSNFTSGSSSSGATKKVTPSNGLPALADIESCSYINDYLNIKSANNPTEVTKLQTFLVNTEEMNISVNGIFDENTFEAVKAFQTKYLDEVMLPWGLQTATGVVSYTTRKKINEIYCKTTFSLTPEQIAEIERYRTSLDSSDEFVAPDNIEVGFAEPEVIETPALAEQTEEAPIAPEIQQTQTASALDASGGFFQKIINFFKNIF